MSGLAVLFRQLATVVWVAGFVSGATAAEDKAEGPKAAPAKADFSSKVLLINVKGPPEWQCFIEEAGTRTLGDRTFIVGKLADEGSGHNPWVGQTVWIPPDQASRIIEFKNLDEARKLYHPQSSPNVTAATPDESVIEIEERSFHCPLKTDPASRARINRMVVYTSTDEGKTWKRFTEVGPEVTQFRYDAPRPGLYWFTVQIIDKDGAKFPAEEGKFTAAMKVRVKDKDVGRTPPSCPTSEKEGATESPIMERAN